MAIKISELPDAAPISSGDFIPVSQGIDTFKATAGQVVDAVAAATAAAVVSPVTYTQLPTSATTIAFNDTTGLLVGSPVAITQTNQGIRKYNIISAIDTDTTVTIIGPPLAMGDAISEIAVLQSSSLTQIDFVVPNGYDFDGSTNTLIADGTSSNLHWRLPASKLVAAFFSHAEPGTGTQPRINITIDGTPVFTDNSGDGVIMSSTANTLVTAGLGTTSVTDYTVNWSDEIEIAMVAGSNQDSLFLTATMLLVRE